MWLTDEYLIIYDGETVGYYYIYEEGKQYEYTVRSDNKPEADAALKKLGLSRSRRSEEPMPALTKLMTDENRVKDRKQKIFRAGKLSIEREPQETDEKYYVYRVSADKGEQGYSEKEHSVPHYEGPKTPEGMDEWCSWYCFVKMDDGTYGAELDEAWCWGGSHNEGGTIRRPIPEEWFSLPYEEFLDNVLSLCGARHYLFDLGDLKACEGLEEFFGYK
ncbi:hypothetical protein SAMN02910317_02719 [Ruminococcaceae bacterium FB2012]|nr:hypothetical protein SAMN02910317_02719 [Ruminococcaceae bacterium FB2012]